jgi:endonuclease YncB( thermonuclease family)
MKFLICLSLFFCLFTLSATAQKKIEDVVELIISKTSSERSVKGEVINVYDGDTCTIIDKDKREYKVRLSGIDAPEFSQDFAIQSKKNLSDLISGKEVTIIFGKVDFYGRYVGKILVRGVDANLEQIKAGFAWHHKKYADEQSENDRKTYADAEVKAREGKKGLWTMPTPVPPWDFNSSKKTSREKESKETNSDKPVKKADGRTYILGPRGGCYYINDNGNKVYVKDKSLCEN